mgnify:CR=1 FL=1
MKPLDLLQYIGAAEYKRLDPDGKAYGCMMPIYLLYPDLPRYDWPEEGPGFIDAVLNLLKKHGHPVDLADIQPGDVVAFRMPFGFLHVGVYLGDDWIIHCVPDDTLERCRFSYICRRLEGIFRWKGGN